ncbi:MAG: hypothetical protein ACFFCI_20510 [Promethearchaeota archaeon]
MPKERVEIYLFLPSSLFLVLFTLITLFPEFQFLHGYSVIVISILVSLIVIGLAIHLCQEKNRLYFIHKYELFFLIATVSTLIIFLIAKVSEREGYI